MPSRHPKIHPRTGGSGAVSFYEQVESLLKGPPLNHAYPRAFDARTSFVNDARIPAQDSRALNAYFTHI